MKITQDQINLLSFKLTKSKVQKIIMIGIQSHKEKVKDKLKQIRELQQIPESLVKILNQIPIQLLEILIII